MIRMASKKYTRRTTRDKLIDLLEEAIRLVKVRCVASDNVLEEAKREFQEAADMKNQAAALLKTARDTPYPEASSNGFAELPEVPEVPALPEVPPVVPQVPATPARLNTTLKAKKLPSCPGGPKAFNEFLKANRAKVEANLGPNAKYDEVRTEISRRWKISCNQNTKKKSKIKTAVTPGRVNAPVSVANSIPLTQPEVPEFPEVPEVPEVPESESLGYEDEGVDDTQGMRRIVIEGRPLYMTNSNKGLFERSDDEVGAFVGYLRNGKIIEQDAPNEA
jgi:hypothetical protein